MVMRRVVNKLKAVLCSTGLSLCALNLYAQLPDALELNLKQPYYIEVNSANKLTPYEIYDGLLHLQYTDEIGAASEIQLEILNWKLERVAVFTMDKSFGLNNYTINLVKRLPKFDDKSQYHCVLKDESGKKYEWDFRAGTPLKTDLSIDILVSPERVSCKDALGNMVEFAAHITRGKAPYSVRWYVMNNTRTDFLYQPMEDKLPDLVKTSVIQVDKAPEYYVMLDVTDACGTNAKKMVYLECGSRNRKVNTLFVAPLEGVLKKGN
jgi:hypothetical protein